MVIRVFEIIKISVLCNEIFVVSRKCLKRGTGGNICTQGEERNKKLEKII
jgi:hypothetical protein